MLESRIDPCQHNIYRINTKFLLIFPFSNCTFPYNYLVTTSSQSNRLVRKLLISKWIHNKNHFSHFKRGIFRTVTGGLYRAPVQIHRNFADLRLLAIPPSCFQVAENNPFWKLLKIYSKYFRSSLKFPL